MDLRFQAVWLTVGFASIVSLVGAALGPTYRDAWSDALSARGLDPDGDLPASFTDDWWWRGQGASPPTAR